MKKTATLPTLLLAFLLCFVCIGCSDDANRSADISSASASGQAASGQAASGQAASGSSALASNYEITPEMDATLQWLASHQEKWTDEANQPDKYTLNAYSVTDLDHDDLLEIAQFIDADYVAYTEFTPDGTDYRLDTNDKFNPEEYAMGIRCEEDGMTNEFKRDEHPDITREDVIAPRTDAAWALGIIVTPDSLTQERHKNPDDKHLSSVKSERVFFGSGLELIMTRKIKEEVLYEALKESLTAFLDSERISAQVRDDLIKIYESDDYINAAKNHEKILVTDEDGDGHPTLALFEPSDNKSKDYRKEDMIAVEAIEGDSSCVGLAFMNYSIWKVYLEDKDVIPKKSIIFGITMEGNKYLNHYFPKMMQ